MKKFNKISVIKIVASALGAILVISGGILTYKHFKTKPNRDFDFESNSQKEIVSGFAKSIKLDKETILLGLGTDKDTSDVTNYVSFELNDWETISKDKEINYNTYVKTYADCRIINLSDNGLEGDIVYKGIDLNTMQLQSETNKDKGILKVDITHATNNSLKVLDKSLLENVIGRITSISENEYTNGYMTFAISNSISDSTSVSDIEGSLELDEQGKYVLSINKDTDNKQEVSASYKE